MKKRWGWPTLPGMSEKGDPSGLFFFCLLSIRPYFTFDGGNVQFILSLSEHTNNRQHVRLRLRALLTQRDSQYPQ
jgi:hypothetical protein